VSDPRNPNLLKMFQMLGLGEKAGSGFQKILRAWQEQHWMIPLVAENLRLEMTRVWLPVVSMIPENVERELRSVVGEDYRSLDELGRVILMLAHRFGEISNEDIQHYRPEHPRDIGIRLGQLAAANWLNKAGHGRGTRYRWPVAAQRDLFSIFDETGRRSEQSTPSSEHLTDNSEHFSGDSEHFGSEHNQAMWRLAEGVRNQKRVAKSLMENTIIDLCESQWLSLQTLSRLLGRDADTLRNHYINPMLKDGRLEAKVPDKPNHPGQAYRKNTSR
jgi:ATP-dependent DNA helicase RecG